MWAVLSCIHANLEALDAVLADIAKHPVTRIFCLGDVVGYGPNPIECLEHAMKWDVTLMGNHDQGAMFDPDGFSASAESAIFWQRRVLEQSGRADLWEFLGTRPRSQNEGDFLLVHGSPRNPTNEYVFPEEVDNAQKMTRIFSVMRRYSLCGHTHVPGLFGENLIPGGSAEDFEREAQRRRQQNESQWQFLAPPECEHHYQLDGRKTIVNVGSVGQPRDGDWRACYVLVDGDTITFRRVEYDVEATVQKIYAIPELENFLGDRLREGR